MNIIHTIRYDEYDYYYEYDESYACLFYYSYYSDCSWQARASPAMSCVDGSGDRKGSPAACKIGGAGSPAEFKKPVINPKP